MTVRSSVTSIKSIFLILQGTVLLPALINSPAVKSQDGVLVKFVSNDRNLGHHIGESFSNCHQEVIVSIERIQVVEVDEKVDTGIPVGRRAFGSPDFSAPNQSVVADEHIA